MTMPKPKITIFGFNFNVFKISFLGQTETSSQNKPPFGQVENSDVSDIEDVFSPTFISPTFQYSSVVKYGKLDV